MNVKFAEMSLRLVKLATPLAAKLDEESTELWWSFMNLQDWCADIAYR